MKVTKKKLKNIIRAYIILEQSDDAQVELENIVIKVINLLEKSKITGDGSLISQIDNQDEFEDFIRYIFDEAGLKNKVLGSVAMSIGKDFLENPDTAATMSKFNF